MRARVTILACWAVLWLASNLFAASFVLSERYVYFWDWAGYWNQYIELSRLFGEDPITGVLLALAATRGADYGPLPILPLVPLHWLIGDGRLGYVLGLTNLVVVPVAAAFAALVVYLDRVRGARPAERLLLNPEFLLAALSILALSALWAPALRGQPDGAGLLLAALALLVLLRRWYAY